MKIGARDTSDVTLIRAADGSRNVARICGHFGISRQAYYRWKRRFKAHGETGLATAIDDCTRIRVLEVYDVQPGHMKARSSPASSELTLWDRSRPHVASL